MNTTAAIDDDDDEPTKPGSRIRKDWRSHNITVPGEDRGNVKQGWVQADKMSHDAMWKLGSKHPSALPVLHYMIAHIKRGSGGIVVSAQTLAADLGVSTRTIQNAVAVLKQWNFLQVLKAGNSNVYVINSQVAWQGKRGARFATFNAAIKVHEREQDDTVENLEQQAEALLPVPEMGFLGDIDIDVIDMDDDPPQDGDAQKGK